MKDLIERLERATGPDRKLDIEISLASTKIDNEADVRSAVEAGWMPPGDTWPMKFTSSIDAAMTLVPNGLIVTMTILENKAAVNVKTGSIINPETKEWPAFGQPPAVAICIAALKARAAITAGNSTNEG